MKRGVLHCPNKLKIWIRRYAVNEPVLKFLLDWAYRRIMIEREILAVRVRVKCLNVWREAGSVGVLSSNIMAIGNFKLPQLNNLMNTRATITYNISNTQIKTEDRWSHVNSPFCLSRYQERLIRDRSTALNYHHPFPFWGCVPSSSVIVIESCKQSVDLTMLRYSF